MAIRVSIFSNHEWPFYQEPVMKYLLIILLFAGIAAAAEPAASTTPAAIAQPDSLNEHLLPLKPYLDITWKGAFAEEPGQPPMYDIARWERILNGQAIRMMHSVSDGIYGGETILFWDKQKQTLVYYYFTTAGFFTNGTMTIDGAKWISHEYVTNNANGITEVRSTSEFLKDGAMHTVAEFLQNGTWVPGHTIHYVEAPDAKMLFK
jgi:hypothetical protein